MGIIISAILQGGLTLIGAGVFLYELMMMIHAFHWEREGKTVTTSWQTHLLTSLFGLLVTAVGSISFMLKLQRMI